MSISLEPIQIQLDVFRSIDFSPINEAISKALNEIRPQMEQICQSMQVNQQIIESMQRYVQESLRLTKSSPELHSAVTEISNACSSIEAGELAIPKTDEQGSSKGIWKIFLDFGWQKEQFCAFIMQLVYAFIAQYILGFISFDTLFQVLQEIKKLLIP